MRLDLITICWSCFFTGSLLVCFKSAIRVGWLVLLAAYMLALITRQMNVTGLAFLGLAAASLYVAARKRVEAHVLFIAISLLLFLHKLPGFNNLLVFDHVVLSPNAIPFTMYLNLDKPFIGFVLITMYAAQWHVKNFSVKSVGMPLLVISVICLGTAFALHFINWDPKLPPLAWLWAINNLLLVVVCEEAFFRGYLQQIILNKGLLKGQGSYLALFIAALLFGLAHFAGGPSLILLATIAGCGYGWAYLKGGIMASIFTHFIFNALHLFFFTYPALKM